ncbi:hypothetical protein J6590_011676 [Homalodisca vitripennis]|nr:hypothetical protein J6590_011676 [Homalodisca vitripennis]
MCQIHQSTDALLQSSYLDYFSTQDKGLQQSAFCYKNSIVHMDKGAENIKLDVMALEGCECSAMCHSIHSVSRKSADDTGATAFRPNCEAHPCHGLLCTPSGPDISGITRRP